MFHPSASAKPIPVPGPAAGSLYFAIVACGVLLHLAIKKYRLFPTVIVLCFGMQIFTVVAVPIIVLVIRWRGRGKPYQQEQFRRDLPRLTWLPRLTTLLGFCIVGASVYVASSTLTEIQMLQVSAALETLAFVLLAIRLVIVHNAAGISIQKLVLDAVRLVCRLTASVWLGSSLPRRSSDAVVHACLAFSLVAACGLLCCISMRLRTDFQADASTCNTRNVLIVILVLSLVFHVDIGDELLPTILWTIACYSDVVAALPQLRMTAQNGGVVDEMMSHHMALLFASRLLSLAFWWLIRTTWHGGMTCRGWGILIVGLMPLLLLSHYMCYYFRGCFRNGFGSGVPLVCAEG